MSQTSAGALKVRAKALGMTPAEYEAKVAAGEKWCYRCHQWRNRDNFGTDRTRFDGVDPQCRDCRRAKTPRQAPGPSIPERRARRLLGQAWCRQCKAWRPVQEVRGGICQPHEKEEARERYAQADEEYRVRWRQKVRSRVRGVAPLPPEAMQSLTELFGGQCAYCCGQADSWDHVMPVNSKGPTAPGNIVPCCRPCNSSKKTKDVWAWLELTRRAWHPYLVEYLAGGLVSTRYAD